MRNPARRPLTYSSLDQIMPDVDRLMSDRYKTVGNWSLGQICNHLSGAVTASVQGFGFKAPWILRMTLAPIAWRQIMKSGEMQEGFKREEKYMPKLGLDDRAEVEALRASLRLLAAHTGPLAPHPFFGKLSREEWERLHCLHSALHLSFAVPDNTG
jgi:hypothetical protein